MDCHEVEAESVDMVFFCPVFHRVDDEVAHLRSVGGCFVAASGCVGVGAVGAVAVVVAWRGEREIRVVVACGVVIDHIHHHAYPGIVQSLYHLLHLFYTGGRVVGVRGVRAFGRVVVLRVISPVVCVGREVGLVDRGVVVAREYVHVSNPQFLEVVDAGFVAQGCDSAVFCHGQEFTFVHDAGVGVYREIAVMHLVYNGIVDMFQSRSAVGRPSLGVGRHHVDYGCALAVYAYGLCPYAGSLLKEIAVLPYLEGVVFAIRHG